MSLFRGSGNWTNPTPQLSELSKVSFDEDDNLAKVFNDTEGAFGGKGHAREILPKALDEFRHITCWNIESCKTSKN